MAVSVSGRTDCNIYGAMLVSDMYDIDIIHVCTWHTWPCM